MYAKGTIPYLFRMTNLIEIPRYAMAGGTYYQQKIIRFLKQFAKPLPFTALEPVCEALANVIRQRREASGLSLNRLAELTNLSRPMIRFVEPNGHIPTIDTIARISRAFGVLCSKLLAEAERKLQS